ncbi:MSHA biogenesis protein MshP [Vibrio atypicus]|uniref:MSHA biogenesis protein MshP n=1 Tax=Vibrio atypicus TaxID=558271 RepID=UPI0037357885
MSHRKHQTGSLYIVVIFVLVVMGFLATSLSRIEWSNNDAHAKDVIGLQAAFSAHSANELALREVYPPRANVTDEFDVGASCAAINGTTRVIPSAINCSDAQLSCSSRGGELADGSRMYILTSVVICGMGINEMRRSQEVWLRGQ